MNGTPNSAKLASRARIIVAFALAAATVISAPAAAAAAQVPGKVYFSMQDSLVPVSRTVDAVIPATTSMQALLAGPTMAEATSAPAISTAIPAGTTLNSVSITSGVATVDLSSEFVSGGGSASMIARLAQVVYTLTQFSTVDGVLFEIDGVPTTVFGGEGVIVNTPATRSDFESELPAIFVDSPAYGDALGQEVARIRGLVTPQILDGIFQVGVFDGDGRELGVVTVTAPSNNGYAGFDAAIPYLPGEGSIGSLIVWAISPLDGSSHIVVREYQVLLGRGAHCRGLPATHVGTRGNDVMVGTPGDDVMVGFGGHDVIRGGAGDDVLCGNGGRDRLVGNRGDDILYGGNGRDRLIGLLGFDTSYGGPQVDVCLTEVALFC